MIVYTEHHNMGAHAPRSHEGRTRTPKGLRFRAHGKAQEAHASAVKALNRARILQSGNMLSKAWNRALLAEFKDVYATLDVLRACGVVS